VKKREPSGAAARTYVRRVPHPPHKVFRALTAERELAAWFPAKVGPIAEERGAPIAFEERGTAVTGSVLVCEPPHRLEYTFGDETLRWQVRAVPGGSVIVLVTEPNSEASPAEGSSEAANDTTAPKALLRAA